MHIRSSNRRALTILEIILLICTVALLVGIFVPATCGGSRSAPNVVAQANLRSLNTGAANYASDSDDRIFSFTWELGSDYLTRHSGRVKPILNSQEAAAEQTLNILEQSTDRVVGDSRISLPKAQLLHLRYSHLVLMHYLTDRQPEPIAASPFDKNLIDWQENPLAYLQPNNPFPYGSGFPTKAGYDMDPSWTDPAVMQLWPFGSSYQVVPHAWVNDEDPQYTPAPNTPHHMILQAEEDTPLGGRKMAEVAFPSAKVFMYEEFDRFTDAKNPLYASDPNARINLAFFDGSVRQELVSDANSAQDPDQPHAVWQQTYLPLDTFPVPQAGLGDSTPLDLRFRWTKDGLAGVDYTP
ncbi:MAG: hypothetical protein JJ974_07650 [Phycisphaerales bacterium]|nr:hypothetical protein [Phycisphaerales bacterium]